MTDLQIEQLHISGQGGAMKATTVTNLEALLIGGRGSRGAEITARRASEVVDVVAACLDRRASAVAKMPYELVRLDNGATVTKLPDYAGIVDSLEDTLYATEWALCVGAEAYYLRVVNRYGYNFGWRWLAPDSVEPDFVTTPGAENYGELKGFSRNVGGQRKTLQPDEIIYIWIPPIWAETGPGTPPLQPGLAAAGGLHNSDNLLSAYFGRGALRTTLLLTPGTANDKELKKIETWWKEFTSGIRNAFGVFAMSGNIKPLMVGDKISELDAGPLTDKWIRGVAAAMRVPLTVLYSDAANYATAQQDAQGFIEDTAFPECQKIGRAINKQFLRDYGIAIEWHMERLPIMQSVMLSRSETVVSLFTSGIIDKDKALALLGLQSSDASETEESEPAPLVDGDGGKTEEQAGGDEMTKALAQWERKAKKRLREGQPAAVEFESEAIPAALSGAILGSLDGATDTAAIKAVFAEAREWVGYP